MVELFDATSQDFLPKDCEFVHGVVVERPSGAQLGELSATIGSLIVSFVRPRRLGRVFGNRAGFLCFPHETTMVRKSSVTFVATERMPGRPPEGHCEIPPDFVVEILSPRCRYEDVEEKIQDYFKAGVRLVWIVSPRSKTVLIRRLDGTCAALNHDGELSGEQVLPGFTCKVADLFI